MLSCKKRVVLRNLIEGVVVDAMIEIFEEKNLIGANKVEELRQVAA